MNKPNHNKWLRLLRKIHYSYTLNSYIDLPFKNLWEKGLLKAVKSVDCIIFTTSALMLMNQQWITEIKRNNPKLKFVLLLIDSMQIHSRQMSEVKDKILKFPWDLTLSFDKNDCMKYGFSFLGLSYYSKMPIEISPQINHDLYFVGRSSVGKREHLIQEVYNYINSHHGVCDFNLVNHYKFNCNEQQIAVGYRILKKSLKYEEVIHGDLEANCILEILQNGQTAQTVRYFEAVCYNRKLLTNNPNIKNLPFYDPKYMKYFEKAEDIDMDWLKTREKIDYQYHNEFSPVHFIEKIERYFADNIKIEY